MFRNTPPRSLRPTAGNTVGLTTRFSGSFAMNFTDVCKIIGSILGPSGGVGGHIFRAASARSVSSASANLVSIFGFGVRLSGFRFRGLSFWSRPSGEREVYYTIMAG